VEDLTKDIIDVTGYMKYVETLDEDEEDNSGDNSRKGNLDELISAIVEYERRVEEEGNETPSISGYLENVALISDLDRVDEDGEKVLLMTLHSAKGLEFEHVYLAGMEEGVFPSYMTLQCEDSDPEGIEEERRLAYVGITRAKKHLTLTAARRRMVRGETMYNRLSRFVTEIPDNMLENAKPQSSKPAFLFDDGESIDEYEGVESTYGKSRRSSSFDDYDGPSLKSSYQNKSFGSNSGVSQLSNSYKLKAKPAPKKPRAVPQSKPYIAGAAKTHSKGSLAGLSKGMPMAASKPDYNVGDKVSHIKYGVGVVTSLEEGPRDYKVTVNFDDCGQKIMYAAFAKLKKV
jgi:DNA helicase-2/ATP-dependent DNA helicase PcrA